MQQNDTLLDELRELQIHVDNHRMLALLPLVFVAWADGRIRKGERETIMEVARANNFLPEGGEGLLTLWLQEQPTPEYYEKGFAVLRELARRERDLGATMDAGTLQDLIGFSLDVAKAAGGLFDKYWTVCAEEEVALAQIAAALSIDDGGAWAELQEDLA
jgi:tellurite resistance protein